MPAAQQRVIRNGPVLNRNQQLSLIREFTKKDVMTALRDIDDYKAPGGDGFNAYFFKQAWATVEDEEFSKVSKQVANQTKSNIYFGGVTEADHQDILQFTGFKKGTLPFKYLGVPLSSNKLSINQCQLLLDNMFGSIQNWTVKFVSYAGRLQLVQNVLLAIQNFWSQVFCLPKKVLKQVETVCKRFLWNGEVQNKGKALIAWKTMCQSKSAGGLNIVEVQKWNHEAILKHLWNLANKKDKHTYYRKGRQPWVVKIKQAS